MKRIVTLFLLLIVMVSCKSQHIIKSELMLVLEKNIHRIEFSKLSFFPKELIQLGIDTAFQSKFRYKLNQHDNIKRKTEGDQREYQVALHLLYTKIATEKGNRREFEIGKQFLLDILDDRRQIHFSVDEDLILEQIDATKRSLINGYDEGTVSESLFIFFCYDPLLYKQTLMKNSRSDDWKRAGIFLCNYLRENENPLAIRGPIKQEILRMLRRRKIEQQFEEIVGDLAKCDVSSDLFD